MPRSELYRRIRGLVPVPSFRVWLRQAGAQAVGAGWVVLRVLGRRFRGSPTVVYIGDSHAYAFCTPRSPAAESQDDLRQVGPREYLCWLGPRLMHSVGARGLSSEVRQRLARAAASGPVVMVWFLGEIDIRVFGTRYYLDDPAAVRRTVGSFLEQIERTFPSSRHVITVPTAPTDLGVEDPAFPRSGTLAARLAVFEAFRSALRDAVGARHRLFDPNQLNAGRSLGAGESDDGCHFRFTHALKLRSLLHQSLTV